MVVVVLVVQERMGYLASHQTRVTTQGETVGTVRRASTATDPAHLSATQAARKARASDRGAVPMATPGRLPVALAVSATVLRTPEAVAVFEAQVS